MKVEWYRHKEGRASTKEMSKRIEANLVSFVPKEVNFIEVIKVSQAVCLVPSLGKHLLHTSSRFN